jgi:hypothetical protein
MNIDFLGCGRHDLGAGIFVDGTYFFLAYSPFIRLKYRMAVSCQLSVVSGQWRDLKMVKSSRGKWEFTTTGD